MSEQTITEFLEARIAEDEAAAIMRGNGSHSIHSFDIVGTYNPQCPDCRGLPGTVRALAECAAKRAIIKAHPIVDDVYEVSTRVKYGYACSTCFSYGDIVEDHGYCDTLRALAAVYSSHPDYDTGWAL